MRAVEIMLESGMSLRRTLRYAGCSRKMYYYEPIERTVELDPSIVEKMKEIALRRPSYGTRRMAAMLSRELHAPVNRKQVQRAYRTLNWIEPSKTKSEIIRSAAKLIKATRPYELWETDITYVACGVDGWCYLFNALDVFQREWLGYAFETSAVKEHAIMSVNNALAAHPGIDVGGLTLRCDNGPQYRSNAFRESMRTLGIKVEYIFANTPEQNGHVESFHKTLKKEYLWPRDFQNYQEAEMAIADAFKDYNHERIHSALDYLTPYEYLEEWRRVKN
jgi:putative transposase